MTDNYIVAFCGLPSSGKSTMINSLIGERILQSGVCRTTTETNTLSNEIITDDHGNKFIAIDLPGICDSEEKDMKFNEMTYGHITNANLVLFVSDVNKAFITTHEVNEYNKIKKIVKDLEKEIGTIYNIAIVLTKCDFNVDKKEKKIKNSTKPKREISDSDEDTNLGDLIDKVKEKLPNEDIILFNAFGRIKHNNGSSLNLKKMVAKSGVANPTKNNIAFSIKKYCHDIKQKQELSYVEKFNERFTLFLENKLTFEKVMEAFNNMNEENKYRVAEEYTKEPVNFKHYLFVETILSKNPRFYDANKNKFSIYRLRYYFYMINNNLLAKSQNLIDDYSQNIWKRVFESCNDLDFEMQNNIINIVLFKMNAFTNTTDATRFLNNCFVQMGGFNRFKFMDKFNKFIKSCNKIEFDKFYNILMPFCTPQLIAAPQVPIQRITAETYRYQCKNLTYRQAPHHPHQWGQFECNSVFGYELEAGGQLFWLSDKNEPIRCNTCIGQVTITPHHVANCVISRDNDIIIQLVNKYLMDMENQINDPKYILYNKLQILKYLFEDYNQSVKQTYHFKDNKLKGNTILEQKIMNHPKYNELERKFYDKFICKLIVPFNSNNKYENIVFMSIDEILYLT
jgi:GTPase SAR1 family protein